MGRERKTELASEGSRPLAPQGWVLWEIRAPACLVFPSVLGLQPDSDYSFQLSSGQAFSPILRETLLITLLRDNGCFLTLHPLSIQGKH